MQDGRQLSLSGLLGNLFLRPTCVVGQKSLAEILVLSQALRNLDISKDERLDTSKGGRQLIF